MTAPLAKRLLSKVIITKAGEREAGELHGRTRADGLSVMVAAIVMILTVVLLPTKAFGDARFTSPERTLTTYIDGLRRGDIKAVAECFEPEAHSFYLPGPLPIARFRVVKRIILNENETDLGYGFTSLQRKGDVRLHVQKVLDGQPIMFYYTFRRVRGDWKIVAHAGDTPR